MRIEVPEFEDLARTRVTGPKLLAGDPLRFVAFVSAGPGYPPMVGGYGRGSYGVDLYTLGVSLDPWDLR